MIAVDIVNYKTWETTMRCVDSIRQVCTRSYHIYIVDNQSPNDSYQRLCAAYVGAGDVTVIDSGRNGGYGYGLNRGIEAALADGCDAVIASNNDVVYLEGTIEKMYDCLFSSPQIGCAGAVQQSPDGKTMYSAQFAPDGRLSLALSYFPLRGRLRLWRFNRRLKGGGAIPAFCPIGGCYMLKGEALKAAGLFDERVFMYCEENILGFKFRAAGYETRLCTRARVVHEHGKSTGHGMALRKVNSACGIIFYGTRYLHWSGLHRGGFLLLLKLNLILKREYTKGIRKILRENLHASKQALNSGRLLSARLKIRLGERR